MEAEPWKPRWLDGGESGVDSVVVDAAHHRVEAPGGVPIDPFVPTVLPDMGFATYASKAHRQAVRKAVACAPGTTVIVNLPTGAGKSTVALAPAFLHAPGTSVFVVPTIALAFDQERRVRELTGNDHECFAYTSNTPLDVRREILASIYGGHKTIVFIAPESATQSLAPPLFAAAKLGALKYFVVDESHLVDQWGTEFRPEYQAMAGLRSELLAVQRENGHLPFRTLLMTATLGSATADLLVDLFGDPGPVELAMSNRLRPEPSYWVSEFKLESERSDAMIEALSHLPRPAIVYCMTPQQARERHAELSSAGFKRSAVFHGKTRSTMRREILKDFRSGQTDLVVATSAFGLGVDIADVRTIVHACIPETIDRYYQEVGRAGRDGAPSISVLCWTERDKRPAWRFSHPKIIKANKGLRYWDALLRKADIRGNKLVLRLNATPAHIEQGNEEVERWHIRTISLLVRAGLLKLSWVRPTMNDRDTLGIEARELVVENLNQPITEDVWERCVEPVRQKIAAEADRTHNLMIKALSPGVAICELIHEAYDLRNSTRLPPDRPDRPNPACGGCPAHREDLYTNPMPPVSPLRHPYPVEHELEPVLGDNNVGFATYDPDARELGPAFAEALIALVQAGIRFVHCPPAFLDRPEVAQCVSHLHLQAGHERIFFVDQDPGPPIALVDYGLPLLVVLDKGRTLSRVWFGPERRDHPTLVVLPTDYPDPGGRQGVPFKEVNQGVPDVSQVPQLLQRGR